MIRIANPGSDIDIFIRIFKDLHQELQGQGDFDLDGITQAMIARCNVTSQGAIGKEALKRSTRKDRSRDPLYNQSKMYAELYRTLGWIQSTTSTLRFAFSFLGEHIVVASNPKMLVRECLLGLAYPNNVLEVKGRQSIRIFSTILRTMAQLDGKISRDEMIVGPMSINDDRNVKSFSKMISLLARCRKSRKTLKSIIARMEGKRRITKTTMENYTRFPIAALQWVGWAAKKSGYFHLTDYGKKEIERITDSVDMRVSEFYKIPKEAKCPFLRFTFYDMLRRANFEISPMQEQIDTDGDILRKYGYNLDKTILFSPFQQIARDELNKAFPGLTTGIGQGSTPLVTDIKSGEKNEIKSNLTKVLFELSNEALVTDHETTPLASGICKMLNKFKGKTDHVVNHLMKHYAKANQDIFYPLVTKLFRLLGFDCYKSRRGVHYERADAIIVDKTESIPVEIKSPGEEQEISVKGVRQALENKVVLISRKSYPAKLGTTSLVVGFRPPNDRSEVHELIEDIYKAFGISIGIIDFKSLLKLAVNCIATGKKVLIPKIRSLKGVIDVDNIASKK